MSAFVFILVLAVGVRVFREIERFALFLDRVHALFQVIARRSLDQRLFLFFVFGEGLHVTRQQALLGVRPELDLALATHREARLTRKVGVLIGLADDQLHGVAVARGHAGLAAVAV